MNKLCKDLSVTNSQWANPHGLACKYNKSSAYDMGRLSCKAMANSIFQKVVRTQEHEAVSVGEEGRRHRWVNTNKLLEHGWDGVKTGVTPTAGPCLSACKTVRVEGAEERQLLVVVLGSESMERRWQECQDIVDWVAQSK